MKKMRILLYLALNTIAPLAVAMGPDKENFAELGKIITDQAAKIMKLQEELERAKEENKKVLQECQKSTLEDRETAKAVLEKTKDDLAEDFQERLLELVQDELEPDAPATLLKKIKRPSVADTAYANMAQIAFQNQLQKRSKPTFKERMSEASINALTQIPAALTKTVIELALEDAAIRFGFGKGLVLKAQMKKEEAEKKHIEAATLAERLKQAQQGGDIAAQLEAQKQNFLALKQHNNEFLKNHPELNDDIDVQLYEAASKKEFIRLLGYDPYNKSEENKKEENKDAKTAE